MASVAPTNSDNNSPPCALPETLICDPEIAQWLASARDHLGLEFAFIARYIEGEQREITHVSAEGDGPLPVGLREPLNESYCWHVGNGTLPELIQDTGDHPLARELAITDALRVGCHVATPLRLSDGTLWGSFCAFGHNPDRTLTLRDLKIFKSFAGMAAEIISSALAQDARERTARERVESMLDGHGVSTFQQPIIAFATGAPVGVECLSRFPDLTKRGPDAWFEDAELVGMGEALELTALRCALDSLGQIPSGIYASINVSPQTIVSGAVRDLLQGIEASDLVVEITDHTQAESVEDLAREIGALRAHVRIAIGDNGSGLAGLQNIGALQPDMIKLEMALTRGIESDPARKAMVKALVELGHATGCTIVAEGIESEAEAEAMKSLGVDCGQGYFFSRPLPPAAAQQYLLGSAPPA